MTGGLLGPHWGQRRSKFGSFWPKLRNVWILLGGHVAGGRFERNWGPTEFKEGNLIKSANSSRRGSGGHWSLANGTKISTALARNGGRG